MSSKMEQIIDEIEEYIDSCKFTALSSTKIVVNKEEIEELIAELRTRTPEEIKRYQKMISNKEAILAEAQRKADEIIAQAQIQTNELVSEHQIMQQAYAQANEVVLIATKEAQDIIDKATQEANNIRMGAMAYTDNQLKGIEDILINSIDTSKARYENLIGSLKGYLDVVSKNRAELFPEPEPKVEPAKPVAKPVAKEESKANINPIEIPEVTVGEEELKESKES
ncbi:MULTISPECIES: hypothetical protein [Agathobacter]|uniref:ATPase n=1 Tax=Agathobacter ruminis TaxID=1712665 RepID=A0A2G3E4I8_9FIRM|nr:MULTISPECIES: hypothetical protein [Agathobacter]MCR5677951.1 ATPase [Agathobacter sp.]MDC7302460.1 ATPase [Agathobacter ruminis]PHU38065.1 ATPase [Agathobacter ruminis]